MWLNDGFFSLNRGYGALLKSQWMIDGKNSVKYTNFLNFLNNLDQREL
jgi:hypothetical protein